MGRSAIIIRPASWSKPPGEVIGADFDAYFLVGSPEYREAAWPADRCRALVTDHPGIALRQLLTENQAKRHDLWVFQTGAFFEEEMWKLEVPFRAAAISLCPVRSAEGAEPVIGSFYSSGAVWLPWDTLRYIDFNDLPYRPGEDYLKTYTDAANRLGFSSYLTPARVKDSSCQDFSEYIIGDNLIEREPQYFNKSRLLNVIKKTEIGRDKELSLLVDLSHVRQAYNGTMEHARNLFPALLSQMKDFPISEIKAYGNRDHLEFHHIPTQQCLAPNDTSFFDLCLRPYQFDSPQAYIKDVFRARRLIAAQLDVIGCRCDYIYDSAMRMAQKNAIEACDGILFISEYGGRDVRNLFDLKAGDPPQRAIRLAMEGGEIRSTANDEDPSFMVIGSWRYDHKMLRPVLGAIRKWSSAGIGKARFHFLGDLSGEADLPACVRYSKHDSSPEELEALFASVSGFIYPSVYEGFGLPIMHALRHGKPVLLAETEVNREIHEMTGGTEFYFYGQASDLPKAIGDFVNRAGRTNVAANTRTWDDVARQTLEFVVECARREPADTPQRRARREGLILCYDWEQRRLANEKGKTRQDNSKMNQASIGTDASVARTSFSEKLKLWLRRA